MRLPRMTTRRWMIVVAIVAILMGVVGEVIRERGLASRYRRLAATYRLAEEMNRGNRVVLPDGAIIQATRLCCETPACCETPDGKPILLRNPPSWGSSRLGSG